MSGRKAEGILKGKSFFGTEKGVQNFEGLDVTPNYSIDDEGLPTKLNPLYPA